MSLYDEEEVRRKNAKSKNASFIPSTNNWMELGLVPFAGDKAVNKQKKKLEGD